MEIIWSDMFVLYRYFSCFGRTKGVDSTLLKVSPTTIILELVLEHVGQMSQAKYERGYKFETCVGQQ